MCWVKNSFHIQQSLYTPLMFPMSLMIFTQMPNVLQKFFFSSLPLSFVIKKLNWHFILTMENNCRNYLYIQSLLITLPPFLFLGWGNGSGFVLHLHVNSALQLPQKSCEKGGAILSPLTLLSDSLSSSLVPSYIPGVWQSVAGWCSADTYWVNIVFISETIVAICICYSFPN